MRLDHRIRASIRKNYPDLRDFVLGRFPPFVYSAGGRLTRDGRAPVFSFHDVETEAFAACLQALRDRGQATLDCDAWLAGEPGVLLTFDDGRRSLHDVVFPLLKQYDCRAVAFVCPSIVPEAGTTSPRMLCDWRELEQMHASGHVDVQSHGLQHDLVFTDDQVVDFVTPEFASSWMGPTDAPRIHDLEGELSIGTLRTDLDEGLDDWLGMPVFVHEPREGSRKKFAPDRTVVDSMCDFVRQEGGRAFFSERGDGATRVLREAYRERSRPGRTLDETEVRRSLVQSLGQARDRLDRRLSGKSARHFCAPWYRASDLTLESAVEAGYETVFVGVTPTPAPAVQRVPGSFVTRLPGKERGSLLRAFLARG